MLDDMMNSCISFDLVDGLDWFIRQAKNGNMAWSSQWFVRKVKLEFSQVKLSDRIVPLLPT